MIKGKFNHVGNFIDGVEVREEMIVKNLCALLTIVVDDGGDGLEGVKDATNDDDVSV